MRGPYGFDMSESSQNSALEKTGFFGELQPASVKAFNSVKLSQVYPDGAVLFIEKQEARGVFVLCEGQVKLSISSSEGKTLILRIAKPGDVLGLTSVAGGRPYEVTAETMRPCQVAFIRRDDFLRLITQHPDMYRNILRQMTCVYNSMCEQLRNIGLSASAPAKVAKMLLDWSEGTQQTKDRSRISMPLTHEEIGEFIGISRETVTRTFSELKNRHLVELKGSSVTISDRAALEQLAAA